MADDCEHRFAAPTTRGRQHETDTIPPPEPRFCPECKTWLPPLPLGSLVQADVSLFPAGQTASERVAALLDASGFTDLVAVGREGLQFVTDYATGETRSAADAAPLFPDALGAIMHDWLNPTPPAEQDGPPGTHTFALKPPCDLDDCCATGEPCACNCHRPQPTHTLEPYE